MDSEQEFRRRLDELERRSRVGARTITEVHEVRTSEHTQYLSMLGGVFPIHLPAGAALKLRQLSCIIDVAVSGGVSAALYWLGTGAPRKLKDPAGWDTSAPVPGVTLKLLANFGVKTRGAGEWEVPFTVTVGSPSIALEPVSEPYFLAFWTNGCDIGAGPTPTASNVSLKPVWAFTGGGAHKFPAEVTLVAPAPNGYAWPSFVLRSREGAARYGGG